MPELFKHCGDCWAIICNRRVVAMRHAYVGTVDTTRAFARSGELSHFIVQRIGADESAYIAYLSSQYVLADATADSADLRSAVTTTAIRCEVEEIDRQFDTGESDGALDWEEAFHDKADILMVVVPVILDLRDYVALRRKVVGGRKAVGAHLSGLAGDMGSGSTSRERGTRGSSMRTTCPPWQRDASCGSKGGMRTCTTRRRSGSWSRGRSRWLSICAVRKLGVLFKLKYMAIRRPLLPNDKSAYPTS